MFNSTSRHRVVERVYVNVEIQIPQSLGCIGVLVDRERSKTSNFSLHLLQPPPTGFNRCQCLRRHRRSLKMEPIWKGRDTSEDVSTIQQPQRLISKQGRPSRLVVVIFLGTPTQGSRWTHTHTDESCMYVSGWGATISLLLCAKCQMLLRIFTRERIWLHGTWCTRTKLARQQVFLPCSPKGGDWLVSLEF